MEGGTRKFKVYLDTSVISYLSQNDAPEKMRETLEFWNAVKDGFFDIYISEIVIDEIQQCAESKRMFLFEHLAEINYTVIERTDEVESVAAQIIAMGILPPKSRLDSLHIASAITAGCHYIASWNMKHMANVKTNRGVRLLTIEDGYNEINIVTPAMLKTGE